MEAVFIVVSQTDDRSCSLESVGGALRLALLLHSRLCNAVVSPVWSTGVKEPESFSTLSLWTLCCSINALAGEQRCNRSCEISICLYLLHSRNWMIVPLNASNNLLMCLSCARTLFHWVWIYICIFLHNSFIKMVTMLEYNRVKRLHPNSFLCEVTDYTTQIKSVLQSDNPLGSDFFDLSSGCWVFRRPN